MNNVYVLKPVISEKSMKLAKDGLFTFTVNKSATKPQIAEIVEDKFGVDVVEIKTSNSKDEKKTQRSRKGYFVISGSKKALLRLKKGQKIDMFIAEDVNVTTADESKPEVKEKKSLLKGTKVKVERISESKKESKDEEIIEGEKV